MLVISPPFPQPETSVVLSLSCYSRTQLGDGRSSGLTPSIGRGEKELETTSLSLRPVSDTSWLCPLG